MGIRRVGILRPYPLGRMRENWAELSLSLSEMMDALAALRPPAGLTVMQSWHPNDANCCWQMAAVNAYGDSIGCTYLREDVNFGSALETSLAQTWEHPLYRELRSGNVESSCGSCSASQNSHGGLDRLCISWALERTGSVRYRAQRGSRPACPSVAKCTERPPACGCGRCLS